MKTELIVSLASLLTVAGIYWFVPLMTRGNVFFSAAVDSDYRNSTEGRRLLRSFRIALLLWTALAGGFAVLLAGGEHRPVVAEMLPLFLLPGGVGFIYWRCFRTVHRRFGSTQHELRSASLELQTRRSPFNWWLAALRFLILLGTAIYLQLHWTEIPQQFPHHWGANGQADAWSSKTWLGVYAPLIAGAWFNLFFLGLAWLTWREARKSTMREVTVRIIEIVCYPMTLIFVMVALMPLVAHSSGFPLAIWTAPLLMLACVAVLIYWSYTKLSASADSEDETPEPQSDDYWKAGMFYFNPEDPAIFVAKRVGIGYTLNFANKRSWLMVAGFIVAVGFPVLLFTRRG